MTDDADKNQLQSLFETAQRMQEKLGQLQQELAQKTVEGASGGGLVRATANGRQQLLSIQIEREVVDPEDIGMLEDLVVAAVNQALTKASELAQSEMAQLGQMNLNIPGLF